MLLTTLALAMAAVAQGQSNWYEPFPAHKVTGAFGKTLVAQQDYLAVRVEARKLDAAGTGVDDENAHAPFPSSSILAGSTAGVCIRSSS